MPKRPAPTVERPHPEQRLHSLAEIVVGGIGLLVPEKREIMTRLGLKAVAAATLANLMSATVAGFFLSL